MVVVGGGLGGSALSLMLGRAGYSVRLFERARFPREKPCGEGLLPPGVEVLRELGLLESVAGRPLFGVRYHVGEDSMWAGFAQESAGETRHGLGQRRCKLDATLWEAASSTPGVIARDGVTVTAPLIEKGRMTGVYANGSVWRARLVVAADGSHSTLRRKLGLETVLRPQRLGVRAHYRVRAGLGANDIQVFLRHGYELYVTPLPDDEVVIAALAHADASGPHLRRTFSQWVEREPVLCQLLSGADQTSDLMGRTLLLKRARAEGHPPGLMLLGDASESVDPVTAGGMSLALTSAQLLAQHLPGILAGERLALREFLRGRARAVRTHVWLGRGLRVLSRSPYAAAGAKTLIQAHPETMDALVGLATLRSAR